MCVMCPCVIFSFGINGLFHFGIFRFWGALIFHVTYFSYLSTSNMSPILICFSLSLSCVDLLIQSAIVGRMLGSDSLSIFVVPCSQCQW